MEIGQTVESGASIMPAPGGVDGTSGPINPLELCVTQTLPLIRAPDLQLQDQYHKYSLPLVLILKYDIILKRKFAKLQYRWGFALMMLGFLLHTRGGHEILERGVSLFGSPGNKNSGKLGKNNRDQFSIDQ